MNNRKEELIEEKIKNEKELEILEHQKQRLENRIEYATLQEARAKRLVQRITSVLLCLKKEH